MNIFDAISLILSESFKCFLIEIPGTSISVFSLLVAIFIVSFIIKHLKNSLGGGSSAS